MRSLMLFSSLYVYIYIYMYKWLRVILANSKIIHVLFIQQKHK